MTATTFPVAPDGENNNKLAEAASALVERLISVGVDGVGPFKGAVAVAEEHRRRAADTEEAVAKLINTHVRLAAASGFTTGLGGFVTMPVTVPAGVTGLYVIATRMSAGIAHLRGYDVTSEEVRSVILITLLGNAGTQTLKNGGITIGRKMLLRGVKKIPGKVLTKINQKVGFRLLTKFGEKGVINLHKVVPLIGGPIGAAFDSTTCLGIAKYAKETFAPYPDTTDPQAPVDTVGSVRVVRPDEATGPDADGVAARHT